MLIPLLVELSCLHEVAAVGDALALVTAIFATLRLPTGSEDDRRRVRAVLAYLRG